ncbi:MAG: hypothetical protein WCN27_01195 [Alphaproteobacteria bacterium]
MLKTVYFLLSICVVGKLSATHPAYDFSGDPQVKAARTISQQAQSSDFLGDDLGSTKPTTKDTTGSSQTIRYPKDKGTITDDLGVAHPPLNISTNQKPQGATSDGLEKPADLKVVPHRSISPKVIYHKPSNVQPSYTFYYESVLPSYLPPQRPYAHAYYELPPLHILQSPQVIHYYREVVVATFFIQWYVLPIVHYIAHNSYPPRFYHYETVQPPIYRWPVY